MHISSLDMACEPVSQESDHFSTDKLNNTSDIFIIELLLEIINGLTICSVSSNVCLELLWWVLFKVGKHIDFSVKVIVCVFFQSLDCQFDSLNISGFGSCGHSVDQIEQDLVVIINELFFGSVLFLRPLALSKLRIIKDWS